MSEMFRFLSLHYNTDMLPPMFTVYDVVSLFQWSPAPHRPLEFLRKMSRKTDIRTSFLVSKVRSHRIFLRDLINSVCLSLFLSLSLYLSLPLSLPLFSLSLSLSLSPSLNNLIYISHYYFFPYLCLSSSIFCCFYISLSVSLNLFLSLSPLHSFHSDHSVG